MILPLTREGLFTVTVNVTVAVFVFAVDWCRRTDPKGCVKSQTQLGHKRVFVVFVVVVLFVVVVVVVLTLSLS